MLLVFLFGNFGSFMLYDISQTQNKKTIASLMQKETSSLMVLDIPCKELKDKNSFTECQDGEIIYKGHWYDVVKKETVKDGAVFYCINDKKEETLNAQLNNEVKALFDQSVPGKTSAKTFSKNNLKEYLPVYALAPGAFNNSSLAYHPYTIGDYFFVINNIPSPPPRFIFS
jgi:hypothetical protein